MPYRRLVLAPREGASLNEAMVGAMWLAHREDRIDDMIETMHASVAWRGWSRPGRSVYRGHEGIRAMVADSHNVNGDFRVDLDEITETEPDRVRATGRVVRVEPYEEAPVEFQIVMLDGLVREVDVLLG